MRICLCASSGRGKKQELCQEPNYRVLQGVFGSVDSMRFAMRKLPSCNLQRRYLEVMAEVGFRKMRFQLGHCQSDGLAGHPRNARGGLGVASCARPTPSPDQGE